jgi:signal transduction histidine kinase
MRTPHSVVAPSSVGDLATPLLSGLTLCFECTLRDLPCHDASLPLSAIGHDIDDLLRERHDLPGAIVVDGSAIVAVISRQRWLEELSQPFRAELYLNHPVERAVLALSGEWLVLQGTMPVHEAADLALARGRNALFDPIVVEIEQGRHRLLDAHVLFMAQSRLFAMSRERSESLRGDVEAYARELEQTLVSLRETQDDLVEARRMAAMARMLAGMAHEINTPVGIVLTAVTHLQESLAGLAAAFAEGQLRRSAMASFLSGAAESVALARTNVERAVDLVRSFKRVAVDETSEARRHFELASYLDQVILSLRPLLKHLPHKVTVDCPAGIDVDSYPGALAQILSNLMVNAVEHAFPDGRQGHIEIVCGQEGEMLALSFSDDGCGIPEADQPHLFEPFFTTRGHAGGSGLGLHIVFNLVSKVLHGTISCSSRTGQGTTFAMRFPRALP